MKTLYLIRHSSAEASHSSMQDIVRPLTLEGVQRINSLCEFLNKRGVRFDTIVTSNAVRAFETALYISEGLSLSQQNINRNKKMYTGNSDTYLDILFEQNDIMKHVAFIGHNPQVTDLANYFLNNDNIFLLPCGLVAIQFLTNRWTDVCLAEKTFLFKWTPLS